MQYPFVDNVQLSGKIASEMRRAVTNSAELKGMQAVGYGWHARQKFDVLGVKTILLATAVVPMRFTS